MQKLNFLILFLLSMQGSPLHAGSKKSCGEFEKVEFSPATINVKNADGTEIKDYAIYQAEIGPYRFDAGDTPSIIFNKKTGKSCTAKTFIVSGDSGDLYWLNNAHRAVYRSYSGSEQWVTMVDPETCKEIWKSKANIGNKVESNSIEIDPDCGACEETGNFSAVCECQSAEVWILTPDCDMKRDDTASKKLTGELLHVAFLDKRKVKGAKTSSAKLVQ